MPGGGRCPILPIAVRWLDSCQAAYLRHRAFKLRRQSIVLKAPRHTSPLRAAAAGTERADEAAARVLSSDPTLTCEAK